MKTVHSHAQTFIWKTLNVPWRISVDLELWPDLSLYTDLFQFASQGRDIIILKWYKQNESIGFIQQYYKKKGRKEQGKQMTDEDHLLKKTY